MAESSTREAFDVLLTTNGTENASGVEKESLQAAFAEYRRKKQNALQYKAEQEKLKQALRKDPDQIAALRMMFLETAMKYIGTPYARKYHEPDSPAYKADLFLDCCGLVRRVLRDLKEDFGFSIGPWNQAYMFDTLPIVYSSPADLEPGDLVFVSGIYHNPKAKKQHHNIVHVEIWMGEGEKVLGARWQKGRVEVHDSYQFEAKAYHSMEYHFRSILTWLTGECKSHCPEHAWQVCKFNPSKHSIFALGDMAVVQKDTDREQQEAAYMQQENTGEHSSTSHTPAAVQNTRPSGLTSPGGQNTCIKVEAGRSFITCGGNAGHLVEKHLLASGWSKTDHKVIYTLKWTESKRDIDFQAFREGEQMVNHFPDIRMLTTKIGLLESLSTYYRLQRPRIQLDTFYPQTFRIDLPSEFDKFVHAYKQDATGRVWICKPTGANQGKGIFLVRDLQQVLTRLEKDRLSTKHHVARVIQRYISNPLLLHGRKFDLRVYMLVLWGRQWVVLYREGYVRLCCQCYEAESTDLSVHLTNQYQQKKNPLYPEVKEDTVWEFDQLQDYISSEYGLPQDWVATTLTERIHTVMTICFKAVRHKLTQAVGFFELLGFDFMLDTDFNVWLIEVNTNPALHTNCQTLATISPSIVNETLKIAIETFDKCRKRKPLYPLTTLQKFRKLSIR